MPRLNANGRVVVNLKTSWSVDEYDRLVAIAKQRDQTVGNVLMSALEEGIQIALEQADESSAVREHEDD
jgi:hypothetical protein